MKTLLRFAFLILSVLLITGMATTDGLAQPKEEKIILKVPIAFSTVLPSLGDCMPFFQQMVQQASEGTIMVKIYEPGKLVPAI